MAVADVAASAAGAGETPIGCHRCHTFIHDIEQSRALLGHNLTRRFRLFPIAVKAHCSRLSHDAVVADGRVDDETIAASG